MIEKKELHIHEYTNQWSETSSCTIEIDTGRPCSNAKTPFAVDTQHATFKIFYDYGDIYKDETCDTSNTGSGLNKVELWVAEPGDIKYQHVL